MPPGHGNRSARQQSISCPAAARLTGSLAPVTGSLAPIVRAVGPVAGPLAPITVPISGVTTGHPSTWPRSVSAALAGTWRPAATSAAVQALAPAAAARTSPRRIGGAGRRFGAVRVDSPTPDPLPAPVAPRPVNGVLAGGAQLSGGIAALSATGHADVLILAAKRGPLGTSGDPCERAYDPTFSPD